MTTLKSLETEVAFQRFMNRTLSKLTDENQLYSFSQVFPKLGLVFHFNLFPSDEDDSPSLVTC